MIVLDATTKSLEILLGGAVTTNQLPFVCSYADISQSTFGLTGVTEQDGVSNNGTAVTVATAPAASTSRVVKYLSVENKDTVAATVTVRYNNNGTTRNIVVQALTAGQTLVYDEANGWSLACTSGGGSSLPDPVTVPHGGTGLTTLTAHAVYVGNGTSTPSAVAVGATNTVLHGNTGADPSFSAVVEGDLSLTDITTNNVSTSKHGFAVKCMNISTITLADGATPALDASLGNVFRLAAAGDRTIAVPTNATGGQKIVIEHFASGGARTLALNSGAGGFRFGSDITSLTQTASGKTDYIGCIYNDTDSKWDVVAAVKGF